MNKKIFTDLMVLIIMICSSNFAIGQPMWGPIVNSPEVHADNSVIFRFLAPSATVVKLDAQFEKEPLPMEKDSSGIWSATVGPVKPEMYPYHFVVDGVHVADPRNTAIFPKE